MWLQNTHKHARMSVVALASQSASNRFLYNKTLFIPFRHEFDSFRFFLFRAVYSELLFQVFTCNWISI